MVVFRLMLSRAKEPFNTWSHAAGVLLGVPGLVALLVLADGDPKRTAAFAVYGASVIILYLASTLYHGLHLSDLWEERFRRFDHIAIFLLIAGSYTPVCLITLDGALGWGVFAGIWTIAVAGILLKLFTPFLPAWATASIYVGMGWFGAVAFIPMTEIVPAEGMAWLAIAGITYTAGAVIYALERPDPFPKVFGHHEIFHIFVLGGSLAHFVFLAGYVA